MKNLDSLPSSAQACFRLERTPLPSRPLSPVVPEGISAQFSKVPRPSEIDCLCGLGAVALAMVFVRLELVLRGGRSSGLADSFALPFTKALVGSFAGCFVTHDARVSRGLAP